MDYIWELSKQNKVVEFQNNLEAESPSGIKVVAYIGPSQRDLYIAIADRSFKLIKTFKATDFDCCAIKDDMIPYHFEHMQKSEKCVDEEEVRRFYLRFMNKNFKTYKDDYKAHLDEKVALDFGETTSV